MVDEVKVICEGVGLIDVIVFIKYVVKGSGVI